MEFCGLHDCWGVACEEMVNYASLLNYDAWDEHIAIPYIEAVHYTAKTCLINGQRINGDQ